MIENISPERGGEGQGILRVDITLPLSVEELLSLRGWFEDNGWSVEVDQINDYLAGGDDE